MPSCQAAGYRLVSVSFFFLDVRNPHLIATGLHQLLYRCVLMGESL